MLSEALQPSRFVSCVSCLSFEIAVICIRAKAQYAYRRGFENEKERQKVDNTNLLKYITTEDIRSYGIIPELVGRVPINVTLEMLDRDALIRILTEPKNCLVKQYQKLLELDGVELEFNQEALEEVADISLSRKTGARGLRAIMENVMMDTMYHVPSDSSIKTCLITKECVKGEAEPVYNA